MGHVHPVSYGESECCERRLHTSLKEVHQQCQRQALPPHSTPASLLGSDNYDSTSTKSTTPPDVAIVRRGTLFLAAHARASTGNGDHEVVCPADDIRCVSRRAPSDTVSWGVGIFCPRVGPVALVIGLSHRGPRGTVPSGQGTFHTPSQKVCSHKAWLLLNKLCDFPSCWQ